MRAENIFGGLLLIFAGLLFLLNKLGLLGWDIWLMYIDFWPLLLIALGIRLIFQGSRAVQVIVLILIFVVPVAFYFYRGGTVSSRWVHPGGRHNHGSCDWNLPENEVRETVKLKILID